MSTAITRSSLTSHIQSVSPVQAGYAQRHSLAQKDDSSHFSSLADFDQNYVFTRSMPNENGDVEYNIIIIETNDPSSLTVTHYTFRQRPGELPAVFCMR